MKRAPSKRLAVTDVELASIATQRLALERMAAQMKAAAAQLAQDEATVLAKLQAGGRVESKHFVAAVVHQTPPCRPPWKEELLEHMEKHHGAAPAWTEATLRAKYAPVPREVLFVQARVK